MTLDPGMISSWSEQRATGSSPDDSLVKAEPDRDADHREGVYKVGLTEERTSISSKSLQNGRLACDGVNTVLEAHGSIDRVTYPRRCISELDDLPGRVALLPDE